jgi:hypothetical protein
LSSNYFELVTAKDHLSSEAASLQREVDATHKEGFLFGFKRKMVKRRLSAFSEVSAGLLQVKLTQIQKESKWTNLQKLKENARKM